MASATLGNVGGELPPARGVQTEGVSTRSGSGLLLSIACGICMSHDEQLTPAAALQGA